MNKQQDNNKIPTVQPAPKKAVFEAQDVETTEELAKKLSDKKYKDYIKGKLGRK